VGVSGGGLGWWLFVACELHSGRERLVWPRRVSAAGDLGACWSHRLDLTPVLELGLGGYRVEARVLWPWSEISGRDQVPGVGGGCGAGSCGSGGCDR